GRRVDAAMPALSEVAQEGLANLGAGGIHEREFTVILAAAIFTAVFAEGAKFINLEPYPFRGGLLFSVSYRRSRRPVFEDKGLARSVFENKGVRGLYRARISNS